MITILRTEQALTVHGVEARAFNVILWPDAVHPYFRVN